MSFMQEGEVKLDLKSRLSRALMRNFEWDPSFAKYNVCVVRFRIGIRQFASKLEEKKFPFDIAEFNKTKLRYIDSFVDDVISFLNEKKKTQGCFFIIFGEKREKVTFKFQVSD